MKFYEAFKKLVESDVYGMRLSTWEPDVIVRVYDPGKEEDLERIAESIHNAWWEEKKKQGITDHPDMKPYAELEENVKEYDRVTARTYLYISSLMTAPFLYVESRYGKVPWKETMIELFADNWEIVL